MSWSSRPSLGRFGVTARLFHMVDEMPRDKQLILLKQLLGERITSHLCKLIVEMTDDQLQRLCEQLDELPFEDAPVTTINLDEDGAPMRQISRASCQLKAICVADGHTFESVITDISTVGIFIKSPPAAYPAGKPIRVSCRLPGREKASGAERRGPAQRSGRHRRAADRLERRAGNRHPPVHPQPALAGW